MDTLQFLKAILPEGCWYFIAVPSPTGHGFKHFACSTVEEAAARVLYLDQEQKQNVYYACSGYRAEYVEKTDPSSPMAGPKKKYRVKENVKLVKAFWLDLDVGEPEVGKAPKYASQAAAVQALGQFLVKTGLPKPMIVNSGYGVHVYWPLANAILPGQWTHTAGMLKALVNGCDMLTDNSRTSDEASVLRPAGTTNRKVKNGVAGAMPVTCNAPVVGLDYQEFHRAVADAAKKFDIATPGTETKKANPTELIVPVGGYQKSSAERVATLCNQMKVFKDTGGISEPHWYHALQVIAFTEDGDKHVHAWSAKHADYNEPETTRKLIQIKSLGPTTCAKLEDTFADGCRGCPYKGRISSPIQLGVEVKEAKAPTLTITQGDKDKVVELPNPPAPFKRGNEAMPGLYIEIEPGVPVRFYPYDLYPVELCKDDEMGYEVTRVRHHLPLEGWQEFGFRSALVASQREFTTAMMDNSVKPENAKFMAAYMNGYLQELQGKTKIRKLYGSMGWKDEGFLLGRKLYTTDGVQAAGVGAHVSAELVDGIAVAGTLEGWQAGVRHLDQPGLEAHLFSFLVGFGAPLFSVTEYDGAMLSMLGDTNSGKTLSAKAMLSIYGKFKNMRIGKDDTLNAKIAKMAMLGNLPVYIDELTNVDNLELSQFIYQVSEGRGRGRLRSDATMRSAAQWQTLGVTSTNASLMSKLAAGKDNAEAEMCRLLEYRVEKLPWFEKQMSAVHDAVTHNFGHAGEMYVKYLVASDRPVLKAEIDKVVKAIMERVEFEGKERYWVNTCAVVLYGAVIAQALGILGFKDFGDTYTRLFHWVTNLIRGSRGEVQDARVASITVLSQFLDAHMSGRLVVNEMALGEQTATTVVKPPLGPLVVRYEQHTGALYLDRKALKKYLTERQVDYNPMKRELLASGVLVNADKKKVLGSGTTFTGGQTDTWWVNARHEALADVVSALAPEPDPVA